MQCTLQITCRQLTILKHYDCKCPLFTLTCSVHDSEANATSRISCVRGLVLNLNTNIPMVIIVISTKFHLEKPVLGPMHINIEQKSLKEELPKKILSTFKYDILLSAFSSINVGCLRNNHSYLFQLFARMKINNEDLVL